MFRVALAVLTLLLATVGGEATVLTVGQLEAEINADINANGRQAITGTVLNGVLIDMVQSLSAGGGGGGSGTTYNTIVYFDTEAQFQAQVLLPPGLTYVYVRAVTGTYPPAVGKEATPLLYRPVGLSTLFGAITVAGQVFEPVYSRNPVNLGEFGIVPDAAQVSSGYWGTITGNGTNNIVVSGFALGPGERISTINWHSQLAAGATIIPPGTTVESGNYPNYVVSKNVSASVSPSVVGWWDSMVGTDSTVAFQAGLDYAMQTNSCEVFIPYGGYLVTQTLHFGWGEKYHCLHINAGRKSTESLQGSNPIIYSTVINGPAIAIQGIFGGAMSGLQIVTRNMNYALYGQTAPNNISADRADWLAPEFTPGVSGGLVPAGPGGLAPGAPFGAVVLDPYADYISQPPPVPYPTPTYPAWTGLASPPVADLSLSTDFRFDGNEIDGAAMQFVNAPNNSGNADFTAVVNNTFGAAPISIAACNGQGRSMEIRHIILSGEHTFATNNSCGNPNLALQGAMGGVIEGVSGNLIYQFFDLQASLSGALTMKNFYCETCIRFGNFSNGAAFGSSFTIENLNFNMYDTNSGTVPASLMSVNSLTSVKLTNPNIQTSYYRLIELSNGGGAVTVDGGTISGAAQRPTADVAHQLAINFTGGVFAGGSFPAGLYHVERPSFQTYYGDNISGAQTAAHLDTAMFLTTGGGLTRQPEFQETNSIVDDSGRFWHLTKRYQPVISSMAVGGGFVGEAPTWAADVMTFGYCAVDQVSSGAEFKLVPGDILESVNIATLFVVTAVTGPFTNGTCTNVYRIATEQQNNLTIVRGSNTFSANLITNFALPGPMNIYHTQVILPKEIIYGVFTSGSPNVTGLNRGDNTAPSTAPAMANYLVAGDMMFGNIFNGGFYQYGSSALSWPITSSGNSIASTTPGSGTSGTLALTGNAGASGTFPIYPRELRP